MMWGARSVRETLICVLRFGVSGVVLRIRLSGLGVGVSGLPFCLLDLGFGVPDLVFRIWGLGLIWSSGLGD